MPEEVVEMLLTDEQAKQAVADMLRILFVRDDGTVDRDKPWDADVMDRIADWVVAYGLLPAERKECER